MYKYKSMSIYEAAERTYTTYLHPLQEDAILMRNKQHSKIY
jgi:hypothetical protein